MTDRNKLEELVSSDPLHIYSEEELDAIEAIDVALALRIARAQHFSQTSKQRAVDETAEVDLKALQQAIENIKNILASDGGDIELVELVDRTVRVKMKGACVSCPNAPLDLKNVVEKIIFEQVPGVRAIENVF